jgi:hypothetical protein
MNRDLQVEMWNVTSVCRIFPSVGIYIDEVNHCVLYIENRLPQTGRGTSQGGA